MFFENVLAVFVRFLSAALPDNWEGLFDQRPHIGRGV